MSKRKKKLGMKAQRITIKFEDFIKFVPNPMHLEVQKTTRMNIYRDRTKYTRKIKHKNADKEEQS